MNSSPAHPRNERTVYTVLYFPSGLYGAPFVKIFNLKRMYCRSRDVSISYLMYA